MLSFGVACDSGFQPGDTISRQLPANAARRFGVGGGQQLSKTSKWGVAGAVLQGGTLDVSQTSALPPALGGRGKLVGEYNTPRRSCCRSAATGRCDRFSLDSPRCQPAAPVAFEDAAGGARA